MKHENKTGSARNPVKKGGFLKRYSWAILLGLLVLAAALPLVLRSNYYRGIATKIMMYMLLASAVNVVNGYSGQFAIGHAGFICVGAYTAAILMSRAGFSFWPAMLLAGVASSLFGLLVALPISHLSGIYLGFVTIGFSEIMRIICLNWTSVTGGAMGIKAIPGAKLFGLSLQNSAGTYYIMLVLLAVMVFCTSRILKSRTGRAWISIRENQDAAASIGINVPRYKAVNLMYATFWEGCVGAFMAIYYHFVDSTMFAMDESFNIISMAIIGGMGTIGGPLVGALLINIITEAFRFLSEYRMVFYAILIIGMMWLRPQGIAGAADSTLVGSGKLFQHKKRRTTHPKPVEEVES